MSPSRLKWGVLLIMVGGTFLAINLGYLSWWVWTDLLYLWPVLLIAIGLEIILKKTSIPALGYVSTLIIIGCFVWAYSEDGGLRDRDREFGSRFENDVKLDYHNESSLKVKADFTNGRLYLNSGDPELIRVNGGGSRSHVNMTSDCSGVTCSVELKNEEKRLFRRSGFITTDNYWKCYLHPQVENALELKLDETDLRLFAEDLKMRTIDLNAIKSDILLKLGIESPQVDIKLDGRSTDVDLVIPDSVGIRIEGTDLREPLVEMFNLRQEGGAYVNSEYATATVKINVISRIDNGRFSLSKYQPQSRAGNSI